MPDSAIHTGVVDYVFLGKDSSSPYLPGERRITRLAEKNDYHRPDNNEKSKIS